jgi:hypothetical protein
MQFVRKTCKSFRLIELTWFENYEIKRNFYCYRQNNPAQHRCVTHLYFSKNIQQNDDDNKALSKCNNRSSTNTCCYEYKNFMVARFYNSKSKGIFN